MQTEFTKKKKKTMEKLVGILKKYSLSIKSDTQLRRNGKGTLFYTLIYGY